MPITFDIYGPKEDKRYWDLCKEIIDSLPKSIEVNYMGPIENENVNDMFQNYDLFFLPTKGENFGHVILESMSAGYLCALFAICQKSGGQARALGRIANGFIADSPSPSGDS